MTDELISMNDIYLQDVVCSVVAQNPSADDVVIYNQVCTMVEIPSLDVVGKILELIKLNRIAFVN